MYNTRGTAIVFIAHKLVSLAFYFDYIVFIVLLRLRLLRFLFLNIVASFAISCGSTKMQHPRQKDWKPLISTPE